MSRMYLIVLILVASMVTYTIWYVSSKNEEVFSQEYNINFKTEYQIIIESLNVMGSADIVLLDSEGTASVLDIKTTHSYKWKMMFGRNKDPKPSRMYELQLGTYALGVCNQENINLKGY